MRFRSPLTTCLVQGLFACRVHAIAIVTPPPPRPTRNLEIQHQPHNPRAVVDGSICGYSSGDPARPLTAPAGYNCRIDTARSVWGFCPTTVGADVSKCGIPVYCIDDLACEKGCGDPKATGSGMVLTCNSGDKGAQRFCAIEALITRTSSDMLFSFGCSVSLSTAEYYVTPTAPLITTYETPPASSAKPSASRSPQSPGKNPDAAPEPTTSRPSSSSTSSPTPSSVTPSRQSTSNPPTNTSKTPTTTTSTSTPPYRSSSTQPNNPFTTPNPNPQTTPDAGRNTPKNDPPNIPALVGGTLGGLALILSSVIAYLCLRQRRLFALHTPRQQSQGIDGGGRARQKKNRAAAAMLETVEPRRELEDTGVGGLGREPGELSGDSQRIAELGPGEVRSELPAERYSRGMEREGGTEVERGIARWSWEERGDRGIGRVGRYLS